MRSNLENIKSNMCAAYPRMITEVIFSRDLNKRKRKGKEKGGREEGE